MEPRRHEVCRISVSGDEELEAYLSFSGAIREWAVVYVHGFGSTRRGEKALALEAACARRGWTFVSFDFRGHGASGGSMLDLCGSGLLSDLEALYGHLAARGVRRLCLVGSSMGGWGAAWFTLRHPDAVVACAMIAPAFDFVRARWARLTEDERRAWRETGRLRVRNEWLDTEIGYRLAEEADCFPLERLAREWPRPLLIFHGMRDDTVPFANSVDFAQQSPYPEIELRLYRNGGHRLLAWKDEMAEAAGAFFATWVGPSAPAAPQKTDR